MGKIFLFFGFGSDTLFFFLLIAILLLSIRDIVQWRILAFLDEWTVDFIAKIKKRKGRRIA